MANKVLNTKIIIRNDTKVNFTTEDPTLLKGEIALELDTKKYKIGNGVDAYTALPYYNHLDNEVFVKHNMKFDVTRTHLS